MSCVLEQLQMSTQQVCRNCTTHGQRGARTLRWGTPCPQPSRAAPSVGRAGDPLRPCCLALRSPGACEGQSRVSLSAHMKAAPPTATNTPPITQIFMIRWFDPQSEHAGRFSQVPNSSQPWLATSDLLGLRAYPEKQTHESADTDRVNARKGAHLSGAAMLRDRAPNFMLCMSKTCSKSPWRAAWFLIFALFGKLLCEQIFFCGLIIACGDDPGANTIAHASSGLDAPCPFP